MNYSSGKKLGLDLGSGYRNWDEFFKCDYIAFDLPSQINQEKQKRPDVCGNAVCLPFKNDTFDFLSCYSVLPYIKNLDVVFKEMYRVMKPYSVAVIIVQNPRGMKLNKEVNFTNCLDTKKLNKLLRSYGFKSIKHHNLKVYFYSTYYDLTSVYAYAIVQPMKN
ncbi:MAG: class I SAM-dependent methyltransferase [Nitrososphaera sp.]|jgi:ubiquinone/menaquinone biosynthesis C-methylase UbiE